METATRLISTRRGAFVLSALVATLAGAMIVLYVARYRDSVKSNAAPVTVLVASKSIASGTPGVAIADQHRYTTATISQSKLLDGAYSDASSLRGEVAAHDIYPGSQLKAADLAPAAANLAASLAGNQRVGAGPLDAAHGLIGEIGAGDRVDVYAGFNVVALDARGVPIAGGQARPVLRLIVSDAPVVSIAGKSSGLSGSGSSNVELKLGDRDAAKVAFASDNGKIWLSLRPSSGAAASSPQVVTAETLLLGLPAVTVLHSFGGRR